MERVTWRKKLATRVEVASSYSDPNETGDNFGKINGSFKMKIKGAFFSEEIDI